MHLELVEFLRCPKPHAPSVLVAAADRTSSRHVLQGVLGCPECAAEYLIQQGVAQFSESETVAVGAENASSNGEDSDRALRVAAQLSMTEGRSVYVLVGFPAPTVLAIRALVPARLLLINSTDSSAFGDPSVTLGTAPAGVVLSADLLPLVLAKFDGVAFAAPPESPMLEQAVMLLKSGGRLVAPAVCAVPPRMSEIVRDEREWVASRDAVASAPIGITRR